MNKLTEREKEFLEIHLTYYGWLIEQDKLMGVLNKKNALEMIKNIREKLGVKI